MTLRNALAARAALQLEAIINC